MTDKYIFQGILQTLKVPWVRLKNGSFQSQQTVQKYKTHAVLKNYVYL